MPKLIILIGPSGSGKSTWAHEAHIKDPNNVVIVNRDKIRELLFGYLEDNIKEYYLRHDFPAREKEVTIYENILIHSSLNLNKTVIVDATHLKLKYLKRYDVLKDKGIDVEYKYFDADMGTLLERQTLRIRKVGKEILERQLDMYHKLQNNPHAIKYK